MKRKPLVIDVSGKGFYLLQMFSPHGKTNIVHINSTPILAFEEYKMPKHVLENQHIWERFHDLEGNLMPITIQECAIEALREGKNLAILMPHGTVEQYGDSAQWNDIQDWVESQAQSWLGRLNENRHKWGESQLDEWDKFKDKIHKEGWDIRLNGAMYSRGS